MGCRLQTCCDHHDDPAGATGTASGPILLSALEKPIDPRYLSLQEREKIRDKRAAGVSLRVIASSLGRPPSTVSRELSRNSSPNLGYQPYTAHRAAAVSMASRFCPRAAS